MMIILHALPAAPSVACLSTDRIHLQLTSQPGSFWKNLSTSERFGKRERSHTKSIGQLCRNQVRSSVRLSIQSEALGVIPPLTKAVESIGSSDWLLSSLHTPDSATLASLGLHSMANVSPLFSAIIYPTFGNWAVAAACAAILFVSLSAYSAEKTGQGGGYSKFAGSGGKAQFSSKWGMFLFYFPSFLLGLYFLFTSVPANLSWESLSTTFTSAGGLQVPSVRMTVVSLLMTLHFLKRCLEVLFIHKYSGSMDRDSVFVIPFFYCILTGSLLSLQQIVGPLPPPALNLLGTGVVLAVVGNAGNFYHHYLLSKLRKTKSGSGKKKYEVPHGGLFEYVACPHYLFEIVSFIGYAMVSQNVVGLCNVVWVVAYLGARSERCAKYYVEKIEDYPRSRKALIPFLF